MTEAAASAQRGATQVAATENSHNIFSFFDTSMLSVLFWYLMNIALNAEIVINIINTNVDTKFMTASQEH